MGLGGGTGLPIRRSGGMTQNISPAFNRIQSNQRMGMQRFRQRKRQGNVGRPVMRKYTR